MSGGYASTTAIAVNGTMYTHPVHGKVGSAGWGENSQRWGYNLGRHFRQFAATVGLGDTSSSNQQVLFEVFADGRKVFSSVEGLGKTAAVQVDITGALRLEIAATGLGTHQGSCDEADAVFADAQILGLASEIPLQTPSPSQ